MPLHRLEFARRHLRGEDLQWLGIGEPTGQCRRQQAGINTGTLGKRDHFSDHQRIAGHDHLIADLGYLPSANVSHVGNALPQVHQHRTHSLDTLDSTASHDYQTARLRTGSTAGYWGIDPAHAAAKFQLGGHVACCRRLQAGVIDQELAGFTTFGNSALAKKHRTHGGSIGQAQQHNVRLSAELGGRCNRVGTLLNQRLTLLGRAIPHHQAIPCCQEAAAHRQPHQADTGKGKSWQIGHGWLLGEWCCDSSAGPRLTAMNSTEEPRAVAGAQPNVTMSSVINPANCPINRNDPP